MVDELVVREWNPPDRHGHYWHEHNGVVRALRERDAQLAKAKATEEKSIQWRADMRQEYQELEAKLAAMTAERDEQRRYGESWERIAAERENNLAVLQVQLTASKAALRKVLPFMEHCLEQVIPPDCPPDMAEKVKETVAYAVFKDRVDSIKKALEG